MDTLEKLKVYAGYDCSVSRIALLAIAEIERLRAERNPAGEGGTMSEEVRTTKRFISDMNSAICKYQRKMRDVKNLVARHNCQRDTWEETLQALDAKLRGPDMTLCTCHGCERGFQLRDMREIGGKRLCIDCLITENTDLNEDICKLRRCAQCRADEVAG